MVQLAQFIGVRAAEILFEPLQLHLELDDLLKMLSCLCVNHLLVLGCLATGEQLTGAIQKLPLPLAEMDGVNGVINGDLLDLLATTDRLDGDHGLELGAVGESIAHRWEPTSSAVPRLRG